jgi:putative Mg2+ transporter-C (MgtC) family protein
MEMTPTIDLNSTAIAIRIGAAVVAGAVIGLDRELKRKPAGLRTHALVSLGSAVVILATAGASGGDGDALSRAVQGIITGIGFLGAGVIMQHESQRKIEGLTTAASIWVAAALGMACGAGLVELVLIGLGAVLLVLIGGDRIERWLEPKTQEERPVERRHRDP